MRKIYTKLAIKNGQKNKLNFVKKNSVLKELGIRVGRSGAIAIVWQSIGLYSTAWSSSGHEQSVKETQNSCRKMKSHANSHQHIM